MSLSFIYGILLNRYDYENKFLRNWVNVALPEERALAKQLKNDLGSPMVRPSSPALSASGSVDGKGPQDRRVINQTTPSSRPPSRPSTPFAALPPIITAPLSSTGAVGAQSSTSPRRSPFQTPPPTPGTAPLFPFSQAAPSPSPPPQTHTTLISQLSGTALSPSVARQMVGQQMPADPLHHHFISRPAPTPLQPPLAIDPSLPSSSISEPALLPSPRPAAAQPASPRGEATVPKPSS